MEGWTGALHFHIFLRPRILTNEFAWLSPAAKTRKLLLFGGIKATKAETLCWEHPLPSYVLMVLHTSLLSLCPQTVFIQWLSRRNGSGDRHRQLPCNHRTETSHPRPRGRGGRDSALWKQSTETSFQLGVAPWEDRLCYGLVSTREDKKTCRQTEPTPAESLDGRPMLGEAGTLNLYNSLDNGYSPQFTGEEAEACRFQRGE